MTPFQDRPGTFYLGRRYDLSAGKLLPEEVRYDSKDLTTHAVCVGMTGSGKTGLCLALLEEAALNGIPALAIDPKGDLGNLLLSFPQLRGDDFRPWVDPGQAERQGISLDELAQATADKWRGGLAEWGQDGSRIQRFNDAVDKVIYTPGSTAGVPLTVLKSFACPPPQVMDDAEAAAQHVQSASSGVLALLGESADPVTSREHILISNVLLHAWRGRRDLDLTALIRDVHRPPFDSIGALDVESFLPAAKRMELGMKLNNLLASPSFAGWREGEPLDIGRLLYAPDGKPRLAVASIAHLNDAERMFFVTILLNEALSWMRSQPGTGSLRALLYMDEVFGYFPPVGNPPSKTPMLTLLKQARAYGLGCVLATQNPVDLDYKGLSNAGTWFLGKLQTERDKARVVEGLQGVAAEAGEGFPRAELERQLSSLGNRVFLMHNVHAKAATVFQSRWALSYLSGPLSRPQIARLMEGRKPAPPVAPPDAASPSPAAAAPAASGPASGGRPLVPPGIAERFAVPAPTAAPPSAVAYEAALLGRARVAYGAADAAGPQSVAILQRLGRRSVPEPAWQGAVLREEPLELAEAPVVVPTASFQPPPAELLQLRNYARWERELKDWLPFYLKRRRWHCQLPGETKRRESLPGESEVAFRQRVAEAARDGLAAERLRIENKHEIRIRRQREALARAEARVAEHDARFFSRVFEMVLRVFEVLFVRWSGGRSRRQAVTSTSARDAVMQRQRKSSARQKVDQEQEQLAALEAALEDELAVAETRVAPEALAVEAFDETPPKSGVTVEKVELVWLLAD